MKRLVCSALALGVLSGCSLFGSKHQLQPDHKYIVEWLGERPLIDRSHLSLQLDTAQQRAHGFAGCNNWFGDYEWQNGHLRISRLATTRKLCAPALMEQEQRYLAALAAVERWEIAATGQLLLWPAQGTPIRLWPEHNH